MNSCYRKPTSAYVRFEFTKDEDIEFFICQNILSLPQVLWYPDYTVSHYSSSNAINIYGITEEDKDILIKWINEYAEKMRAQGIDTIGKIKEAFNRF